MYKAYLALLFRTHNGQPFDIRWARETTKMDNEDSLDKEVAHFNTPASTQQVGVYKYKNITYYTVHRYTVYNREHIR